MIMNEKKAEEIELTIGCNDSRSRGVVGGTDVGTQTLDATSHNIKNIGIHRDLYSFYLMYQLNKDLNDKYWKKFELFGIHIPIKYKYLLLLLVIITFCMQLICLGAVSIAYSTEWWDLLSDTSRESHYFYCYYGEEDLRVCNVEQKDVFILTIVPIHFFNAFCGAFVLFCYILKNMASWFSLYYAYLNYHNQNDNIHEMSSCNFCSGICIANLNVGLCFATWGFALYSIYFGLYFEIDEPSEILLSSLGSIFILEIDDWMVEWFVGQEKFDDDGFWNITVHYPTYEKALIYSKTFFAISLMVYFFVWISMAGKVYEYSVQRGKSFMYILGGGIYGSSLSVSAVVSGMIVCCPVGKYHRLGMYVILSLLLFVVTIIENVVYLNYEDYIQWRCVLGAIFGCIGFIMMGIVIFYEHKSVTAENKNKFKQCGIPMAQICFSIACICAYVVHQGHFVLFGIIGVVFLSFRPKLCKKFVLSA